MISYILLSSLGGLLLGFILGMILFKKLAIRNIIKEDVQKTITGFALKAKGIAVPEISQYIRHISPKFVDIYYDCLSAENHELHYVVGIGYGKALEVLIKDYAVSQNPSEKEKILSVSLHDCIKKYINDASIKNSSELAKWLRNDETHYQKKFLKADVRELKKLILLTMILITAEYEKRLIDNEVNSLKKDILDDNLD